MDAREKLMQILDKPVFPEGKDPLEAVTDYLLENDVLPVVRCKDCKNCWHCGWSYSEGELYGCVKFDGEVKLDDFCSYGERRDTDG